MKQLDRYVAKCFLSSLFICGSSIIMLYVLLDLFGHLNKFLKPGPDASFWKAFFSHYAVYLPVILYRMAPAITLMAALFTVTRLSGANEITPVKASGVSVFRLFRAMFVIAVIISGAAVTAQEYAIPRLFERFRGRLSKSGTTMPESDVFLRDRRGVSVYVFKYYPVARTIEDVLLLRPDGTMITAKTGRWQRSRPGGTHGYWLLYDGRLEHADADGAPLHKPDGRQDIEHFTGPEQPYRFDTDIVPLDMEGTGRDRFYLKFKHLQRQYRRTLAPDLKTQLHQRASYPLMNLVILLIGLPFVLKPEGAGSVFISVFICLIVSLFFFLFNFVCAHMGNMGYVNPLMAAWLPNVFFTSLGLALMDRVET